MHGNSSSSTLLRGTSRTARPGSFRVCTASDFASWQPKGQAKRRAAQPGTACTTCRHRKIKCFLGLTASETCPKDSNGSNPGPADCQPCQQARLKCNWEIDRRKTRKAIARGTAETNTSARNQDVEQGSLESEGPLPSRSPAPLPAQSPPLPSSTQLPANPQTRSPLRHQSCEASLPAENINVRPRTDCFDTSPSSTYTSLSKFHGPLLSEADDQPSYQPNSQPVFTEEIQSNVFGLAQDNLDWQDFVLDWSNLQSGAGELPIFTLQPGDSMGEYPEAKSPGVIKIRYYRTFGPTALFPGRRRLAVRIEASGSPESAGGGDGVKVVSIQPMLASLQPGISPASSASTDTEKLFDAALQQPHPDIIHPILDVFFKHFGGHFPFLSHHILVTHIRSNVASSFLLNSIAALTLRMCSSESRLGECLKAFTDRGKKPWQYGAAFVAKAKENLIHLLSVPEPEVVGGLILLAWADFGENNETGLWMFAGMAIRMAQDLGLDRTPETDIDLNLNLHDHAWPSPDGSYSLTHEESLVHQQKARLAMFWSVFSLDVFVSLATGRPATFRREDVKVPVPSFEDMKMTQLDFTKEVTQKNMIFPTSISFMVRFSEAISLLNRSPPAEMTDLQQEASPLSARRAQIAQLRECLIMKYDALPPEMVLSISNLEDSAKSFQDGVFLQMHSFFFTIIALLSNEASQEGQTYSPLPFVAACDRPEDSQNCPPSRHSAESEVHTSIGLGACQKIVQVFTMASLANKMSYLTSPFTYHSLFVAGSTVLDARSRSTPFSFSTQVSRNSPSSGFFALTAGCDYEFLRQTLKQQSVYFAGVTTAINLLSSKEKKLAQSKRIPGEPEDNGDVETDRVVMLNDTGLVNRYSIRD